MNEESIFMGAVQKQTPEERAVYLDEVCANNTELRQSVELLLKAHDRAGHFLQAVPRNDPTMDQPDHQGPGTIIGPYKLLQPIGEGGMGTVYMAEQTAPGEADGRAQAHQGRHGLAGRCSPASGPNARRWP